MAGRVNVLQGTCDEDLPVFAATDKVRRELLERHEAALYGGSGTTDGNEAGWPAADETWQRPSATAAPRVHQEKDRRQEPHSVRWPWNRVVSGMLTDTLRVGVTSRGASKTAWIQSHRWLRHAKMPPSRYVHREEVTPLPPPPSDCCRRWGTPKQSQVTYTRPKALVTLPTRRCLNLRNTVWNPGAPNDGGENRNLGVITKTSMIGAKGRAQTQECAYNWYHSGYPKYGRGNADQNSFFARNPWLNRCRCMHFCPTFRLPVDVDWLNRAGMSASRAEKMFTVSRISAQLFRWYDDTTKRSHFKMDQQQ